MFNKKNMIAKILLISTPLLAGCQEKSVELDSEHDKAAYAIGVSFGQYLKSTIETPEEYGVYLNKEHVLQGIKDTFDGKKHFTEEEIRTILEKLDAEVNNKVEMEALESSKATLDEGEAYRAEYMKQKGVLSTESGLIYEILETGSGSKPEASDNVEVHYRGTLIDGTEFDSSYARGETIVFPLDRVIEGWTEGLQLMNTGSKFRFVIKPELAYGEQSTPAIPANSTLLFEVELIAIK